MARVTFQATELTDTDVNFVSLVKKGANRIPFRIIKSEGEEMIDLHKILRVFKAEPVKPEVVGAFAKSGTPLDNLANLFKTAGLNPQSFRKSEDAAQITIQKANSEPADVGLMTIGGETVLAISGFKKSVEELPDELSFGVVKSDAINCISPRMALNALQKTVDAIIRSGESFDKIEKAQKECFEYVSKLTALLPEAAIKADVCADDMPKATEQAGKKKEPDGDEVKKATNGTGDGFDAPKVENPSAKATEDDKKNAVETQKGVVGPDPTGFQPGDANGFAAAPADTQRAVAAATADDKKVKDTANPDGSTLPEGTGTGLPAGVEKSEASALSKADSDRLLEAISSLSKSFEARLDAITKGQTAMRSEIEAVGSLARKTDEALSGTVFGEAGGDVVRTQKSNASGEPPLLDTAYSSQRRSAA